MVTQAEKGRAFRTLHRRDGAFIIPNPWDAGTSRILAALGFEALATTSAGFAFSIGQSDNTVGRDKMIEHVAIIAAATDSARQRGSGKMASEMLLKWRRRPSGLLRSGGGWRIDRGCDGPFR